MKLQSSVLLALVSAFSSIAVAQERATAADTAPARSAPKPAGDPWTEPSRGGPPAESDTSAPAFVPPAVPPRRHGLRPHPPIPIAAGIRFAPDEPDVQLLAQTGSLPFEEVVVMHHGWWHPWGYYTRRGVAPVYTPLCQGPCTLHLRRGPYFFALSKGGGPPARVKEPAIISGPSVLRAHYTDRSGIRTAGAVIGIVGTLGGLFMVMSSLDAHRTCDGYGYCYQADDVNEPLLISGLSVFLGSAIAASIMIWQRDEATLSVTPFRWSSTPRSLKDAGLTSPWRTVRGVSATLSF